MTTNIHLKCGIENCNNCYEYKFALSDPIALNGQFKAENQTDENDNELLPHKPEIGKTYDLTLYGPLKIDLSNLFWVLYVDPYSTFNGIENETGIESFTFCLCTQKKIIDLQETTVRLNIEVITIQDLKDSLNYPGSIRSDFNTLDDHATSKNYYHIENFKHYSLISINVQSDIGWTYIIAKNNDKSIIVAGNIWGFHEDFWILLNQELTKEQEERYGIRHGIDPA